MWRRRETVHLPMLTESGVTNWKIYSISYNSMWVSTDNFRIIKRVMKGWEQREHENELDLGDSCGRRFPVTGSGSGVGRSCQVFEHVRI